MLTRTWKNGLATRAGAAIDGAVVRALGFAVRQSRPPTPSADSKPLLEQVARSYGESRFFTDPDAYSGTPSLPDMMVTHLSDLPGGGSVCDLTFRSGYTPHAAEYRDEHQAHHENLFVHARWYRSARPRGTGIFLHGMGGGPYFVEERIFAVKKFFKAGLDVVLFQMPFHAQRKPAKAPRMGVLFPSPHVVRTNETFGQVIHDLRSLILWLRQRDVPQVGMFGMSLGAYTSALLATIEEDLAFCVPMIPAVSLAGLMWKHSDRDASRREAEAAGITLELVENAFRIHSPLARPPKIAKNRRFIIAGHGDRVCPPAQANTLWHHWEHPPIHWFPGGHTAQFGRRHAFRALHQWLDGLGVLG